MKDVLIEFWSDIKNLENASLEDVQKDILAYLKQRQGYKDKSEEMQKALEWYADKDNYRGFYTAGGHWKAPANDEAGERARQCLKGVNNE